jgi:hypothetical protein
MSWETEKLRLMEQFNRLNDETSETNLRNIYASINQAISGYVQNAGINPGTGSNVYYEQANNGFSRIVDKEQQYSGLTRDLTQTINRMSQDADLPNQLRQVGEAGTQIATLEKELKLAKQDADTSRTRQVEVEKPRQNLSWYQGFSGRIGFTKPLHLISVPVLIGFGIFLLFLSGLLLREFFAPGPSSFVPNGYSSGSIFEFFTDSRFYAVLAGLFFVSILLGILAWQGYFGYQIH